MFAVLFFIYLFFYPEQHWVFQPVNYKTSAMKQEELPF